MPPMPADRDFLATWDFVRWADGRMLHAAGTVADPAEYHRPRGISHGSVHAVLLHMMHGQADWLRVWQAQVPADAPPPPDTSADACPDLPAIVRTWPGVHDAVAGYLAGLTAADLATPIRFNRRGRDLSLPLAATITHLLDHCTYHRGQLNTLVTLAGGRRVWLSYWAYALRHHPQASGATDADFVH